jgi:hypothetical protein
MIAELIFLVVAVALALPGLVVSAFDLGSDTRPATRPASRAAVRHALRR